MILEKDKNKAMGKQIKKLSRPVLFALVLGGVGALLSYGLRSVGAT